MSGRYWIAAIAIGFTLFSAPSKCWAESNQGFIESETVIPPSLLDYSESIDEKTSLNEPCNEGEDKRGSDLCAQWKAADAARESADWADRTFWLGLVGTIIGALTLGSAAAAAYCAKSAAHYTKSGVDAANKAILETRRIGEAQVRAYLGFKITHCQVEAGKLVSFDIEVKNYGQSTASNVATAVQCVIRKSDWRWDDEPVEGPDGAIPSVLIHAGGSLSLGATIDSKIDHTIVKSIRDGNSSVFGSALCLYEDVFGQKWETQICFEFSGEYCFRTNTARISPAGNYETRRE